LVVVPEDEVEFGDILVNTTDTKTILVEGANLTDNITYVLTDNDDGYFSVEAETGFDPFEGGELTVTFEPTEKGTHEATLTISSGTISHVIALSGVGYEPPVFPAPGEVIISQVYTGGGNSGAVYNRKYIELFNTTDRDIALDGLFLSNASATGTGASSPSALTGTIKARGFYLVHCGTLSGTNGIAIPTTADATFTNLNPGYGSAKVMLSTSSSITITAKHHTGDSRILDLLAWGTGITPATGSATSAALASSNTLAVKRIYDQTTCSFRFSMDTVMASHFQAVRADATPLPRNSATDPLTPVVSVTHDLGSTNTLDFGEVREGEDKTLTFKLTPACLEDDLTLTLTGGDATAFVVEPESIDQSVFGDTTISVTFSPIAVATYTTTLVIAGGGMDTPIEITIKGEGISATQPEITVVPDDLDFGTVLVGANETKEVKVEQLFLNGAAITYELTDLANFEVDDSKLISDSLLLVTFKPQTVDDFTAELLVKSVTHNLTETVTLTGVGGITTLTVDSTEVRAGEVEMNASKTMVLRVNATLLQDDVTLDISGTHAAMFSVDSAMLVRPANGNLTNRQIRVTYAPTALGEHTAMLTVNSAGVSDVEIPLSGEGIIALTTFAAWETQGITVSNTVTFPFDATTKDAVTISGTPQLTIGAGVGQIATNPGANHIPVFLRQPTADSAAAIEHDTYFEFSLTPADYTALDITQINANIRRTAQGPNAFIFKYSLDGFATDGIAIDAVTDLPAPPESNNNGWAFAFDNLSITDVESTITFRLYVWGGTAGSSASISIGRLAGNDLEIRGFARQLPGLDVTPTTLAFGNVQVDNPSTAQTVSVSGALLTDDITYVLGGDDPSVFAVSETSWNAATGGTLSVVFTPIADQSYSATLVISSDGVDSKTVTLTGTGIAADAPFLEVDKAELAFGDQLVGTSSATQTVTIVAANLTDLDYEIVDENADHFEITPGTFNATTGGTLDVVFKPLTTGLKTVTLIITSDEMFETVTLTGTGVVPTLSTDLTQVDLGKVMTSASKTVELKVSAAHLTHDVTLVLSGDDMDKFEINKQLLVRPTDGKMQDSIVLITYTPTELAQHTATLTISSEGADPKVLQLSGEGIGFIEDFEETLSTPLLSAKTAYTAANYTLKTGEWRICGVGQMQADDRRNGTGSVRFRGNTSDTDAAQNMAQMNFNKPDGIGTVTFSYGSYGTHSGGRLQVQVSTDDGETWENRGQEIVAPSWANGGGTLQTATVVVNKLYPARVRIVKISQTGSTSVNVDDISMTDYLVEVPTVEVVGNPDFGITEVGVPVTRVFTVSGENLTDNITFDIEGADATAFVPNDTEWSPVDGGTLSITFTPTEGRTYNASLVLSTPGMDDDVEISLSGIGVIPQEVANIAAVLALPLNTVAKITGELTVVTQQGRSLFVQDESGWVLIDWQNPAKTYTNGQRITGAIATRGEFDNAPQLVVIPALGLPDGVVGEPAVAAIVEPEDLVYPSDLNRYVAFENAVIAANVTYTTATPAEDGTIEIEGGTMIIRNHYNVVSGSFAANDRVNLKGLVRYYSNAIQIYLLHIEETSVTSIEETDPHSVVHVYPNPVANELFVQAEQPIQTIQILNLSGQIAMQQFGDKTSIDVGILPRGTYIVRIVFDDGSVFVSRIVK
ncbi:MAG: choice-of-anchor D domain-containing protein, partial [Bacteroidales bacterium]|nr:choice-of-anchor D domain-containing protein [Bacteroidales bacterium]